MTDVIVIFHFGLFFAPLVTAQKMKIKKKKEKKPTGDIITLHNRAGKIWHMLVFCACRAPKVTLRKTK